MADENDALTFGRGRYLSRRDLTASAVTTAEPREPTRSPARGVVLGVLVGAALWACLLTPVVLLLRG